MSRLLPRHLDFEKKKHPPYSPHLAQYNFFLFIKQRIHLKSQGFENIEDIKIHWNKCIKCQWDNFDINILFLFISALVNRT